jgi:hypothetical protein
MRHPPHNVENVPAASSTGHRIADRDWRGHDAVGAPATDAVIGRRAGLALPPTEASRSLLIEMSGGKLACQSRPPKPALDFRAIRPLLLPETLVGANFVLFAVLKRPFRAMPEIVNSITDRGRLNCAETGSERRYRWMQGRSFTS